MRARFRDRRDAGRRLGERLLGLAREAPIVIGLPRGGVVVADEVASALGAPLDIWVSRKLGAPMQPELGLGAIAEGGALVLDRDLIASLGLNEGEIEAIATREAAEVGRRVRRFREGGPAPRLAGQTVIVVDDGVATGGTARAALRGIRAQRPRRTVLAVPVVAAPTLGALEEEADSVVYLDAPADLWAIGAWYDSFDQVPDDEVVRILRRRAGAVPRPSKGGSREVAIPAAGATLEGTLSIPAGARGIVLFAHGSGSGRFSPRNRFVADTLRRQGLGTLLFDLLSADEERAEGADGELRFDIGLLAERLGAATSWLVRSGASRELPLGYFGSSTGAAAALVAAAAGPDRVAAIVSRGGRVDLAEDALSRVRAPTLLIVGSLDEEVLALNREAVAVMTAPVEIQIVHGASHLFAESGALERVARLAADWFAARFLEAAPREPPSAPAA